MAVSVPSAMLMQIPIGMIVGMPVSPPAMVVSLLARRGSLVTMRVRVRVLVTVLVVVLVRGVHVGSELRWHLR